MFHGPRHHGPYCPCLAPLYAMQSVLSCPFGEPQKGLVHLRCAFSGLERERLLEGDEDVEFAIRSGGRDRF